MNMREIKYRIEELRHDNWQYKLIEMVDEYVFKLTEKFNRSHDED